LAKTFSSIHIFDGWLRSYNLTMAFGGDPQITGGSRRLFF
jgi:hypothetical protein